MLKASKELKRDIDQAVSKIVRKAHPEDLGQETSELEVLVYEKIESLVKAAQYEQKMFDVHLLKTSGWYWTERLVRKIILLV